MGGMPKAVALVRNQLDRSRLAVVQNLTFFDDVEEFLIEAPGADLALVDLSVAGAVQAVTRLTELSIGRIIAYGPHVDKDLLASARSAGADTVWARSQFLGRGLRQKLA